MKDVRIDHRTYEALKMAVDLAHEKAASIRSAHAATTAPPYGPSEADALEWEKDADLIHDLLIAAGWERPS